MRGGSLTAPDSTTSSLVARRAPTPIRARPRSRTASAPAASPSTRLAARCSLRRSSTSAMTRATRSRSPASNGFTRVATTRSMATAEPSMPAPGEPAIGGAGLELSRRWAWSGLAVVLLAGLGLRLWGVRQGLPYPYNTDEAQHFVLHAVEMFRKSTLNPHYFANPPAFTYLLHFLFRVWYGSADGAVRALELHPEGVYTLARVSVALLGTGSLWLLYATGARLFNRAVGLLAAAIE